MSLPWRDGRVLSVRETVDRTMKKTDIKATTYAQKQLLCVRAFLCYVMLFYDMLCHLMLWHLVLWYVNVMLMLF